MKERAVLLGPPGSGKGTVAARLEQAFGFTHISSGDWLRSEAELNTPLSRQIRMFFENGALVPDELMLEFMHQRLDGYLSADEFLLDGFPRTLVQARVLDQWLAEHSRTLDIAILYECTDEVVAKRITGRRVCPNCDRVYHIDELRPRVAGQCDYCLAQLAHRPDDTEKIVNRRLQIYRRQTEPLIEYYRKQSKLKVIDASQSAEAVYKASVRALNS